MKLPGLARVHPWKASRNHEPNNENEAPQGSAAPTVPPPPQCQEARIDGQASEYEVPTEPVTQRDRMSVLAGEHRTSEALELPEDRERDFDGEGYEADEMELLMNYESNKSQSKTDVDNSITLEDSATDAGNGVIDTAGADATQTKDHSERGENDLECDGAKRDNDKMNCVKYDDISDEYVNEEQTDVEGAGSDYQCAGNKASAPENRDMRATHHIAVENDDTTQSIHIRGRQHRRNNGSNIKNARVGVKEARTKINEALTEIKRARAEIENNSKKEEVRIEIQEAWHQLNEACCEIETGRVEIERARRQIRKAWIQIDKARGDYSRSDTDETIEAFPDCGNLCFDNLPRTISSDNLDHESLTKKEHEISGHASGWGEQTNNESFEDFVDDNAEVGPSECRASEEVEGCINNVDGQVEGMGDEPNDFQYQAGFNTPNDRAMQTTDERPGERPPVRVNEISCGTTDDLFEEPRFLYDGHEPELHEQSSPRSNDELFLETSQKRSNGLSGEAIAGAFNDIASRRTNEKTRKEFENQPSNEHQLKEYSEPSCEVYSEHFRDNEAPQPAPYDDHYDFPYESPMEAKFEQNFDEAYQGPENSPHGQPLRAPDGTTFEPVYDALNEAPYDEPVNGSWEAAIEQPLGDLYESADEFDDLPLDAPYDNSFDQSLQASYEPANEAPDGGFYNDTYEPPLEMPYDNPQDTVFQEPHSPLNEDRQNGPYEGPSDIPFGELSKTTYEPPYEAQYDEAYDLLQGNSYDTPHEPLQDASYDAPYESLQDNSFDTPYDTMQGNSYDAPYEPLQNNPYEAPYESFQGNPNEVQYESPYDAPEEPSYEPPYQPPYEELYESPYDRPYEERYEEPLGRNLKSNREPISGQGHSKNQHEHGGELPPVVSYQENNEGSEREPEEQCETEGGENYEGEDAESSEDDGGELYEDDGGESYEDDGGESYESSTEEYVDLSATDTKLLKDGETTGTIENEFDGVFPEEGWRGEDQQAKGEPKKLPTTERTERHRKLRTKKEKKTSGALRIAFKSNEDGAREGSYQPTFATEHGSSRNKGTSNATDQNGVKKTKSFWKRKPYSGNNSREESNISLKAPDCGSLEELALREKMSQAPSGSRKANREAKQMKAAGRKSRTRIVGSGRSARKPERETSKNVDRDAKATEKQKSKSKLPFSRT